MLFKTIFLVLHKGSDGVRFCSVLFGFGKVVEKFTPVTARSERGIVEKFGERNVKKSRKKHLHYFYFEYILRLVESTKIKIHKQKSKYLKIRLRLAN